MNSEIINWLNNNFGYNISTDYYNNISVWKDWWKGFHEPFHRITFENGEKRKSRDMYTMKMAKKVCEDWASILINDKTFVKVDDEYSEKFIGRLLPSPDAWIDLNYLEADRIIVLSSDNGIITEAAFCSDICTKGSNKLYLEIHRLEKGEYVIENHIFGIKDKSLLSEEPLPDGVARIMHTGSDKPWFTICKPAIVNPINGNNGMGCAVFAGAIDNLKGVDLAYNNLNSDFWLGQKKVFLNKNMLEDMSGDKKVAPDEVNQQLFYYIGETMDDGTGKSMVQEHNPDLRVADNTAGIQAQLDYLSFKVGFGTKHYQFNAGSIVTATQYTGDKQDLIQNAHKHFIKVESFLHGLVKTLLWIGHSFIDAQVKEDAHISIVFDQSPLVDENAERQRDKDDVTAGLMQKWEYRVKWYGESEEEAKACLADGEPTDDELMGFEDGEE